MTIIAGGVAHPERVSLASLADAELSVKVMVCGHIGAVSMRVNAAGHQWASLLLADESGSVEVLCFGPEFGRFRSHLLRGRAVTFVAAVLREGGPDWERTLLRLVALVPGAVPPDSGPQ